MLVRHVVGCVNSALKFYTLFNRKRVILVSEPSMHAVKLAHNTMGLLDCEFGVGFTTTFSLVLAGMLTSHNAVRFCRHALKYAVIKMLNPCSQVLQITYNNNDVGLVCCQYLIHPSIFLLCVLIFAFLQ